MISNITVNTSVVEFFDDVMNEEKFAQTLRRTVYMLTELHLKSETENGYSKDWLLNSISQLNQFAEVLHPILEDKTS